MLCPNCRTNKAFYHEYYGYLPCDECRKKQEKLNKPSRGVEFTSDSIKDERKRHGQDTWPTHRKGQLSKEYIDRYGTKRLKGYTKEEIKKAKNVWKGTETYYKE